MNSTEFYALCLSNKVRAEKMLPEIDRLLERVDLLDSDNISEEKSVRLNATRNDFLERHLKLRKILLASQRYLDELDAIGEETLKEIDSLRE